MPSWWRVFPLCNLLLLLLSGVTQQCGPRHVLGSEQFDGGWRAYPSKIDRYVAQMERFIEKEPAGDLISFISDKADPINKRELMYATLIFGRKHGGPEIRPGVRHTLTSFYRSLATKLNIPKSEVQKMKEEVAKQLSAAVAERDLELERKRQHVQEERQSRQRLRYSSHKLSTGSSASRGPEDGAVWRPPSLSPTTADVLEDGEDSGHTRDVPDSLRQSPALGTKNLDDVESGARSSSRVGQTGRPPQTGAESPPEGPSRPSYLSEGWAAVRKHRKGILAAVAAAAVAAGLFGAVRRMKPWKGIAGSRAFSWNESTCRLALKVDMARRLNAMGAVADVVRVQANNSQGNLEVTYREKPAFVSSKGGHLIDPIKYYLSLGHALTTRKEAFAVPTSCVASRSSTYLVTRNGNDISGVIVDLDFRPAPFAVPREVVTKEEVEHLLQTMSESDSEWTLYFNCTLHLTVASDSLVGPPVVLVDPAIGAVELGNSISQNKTFEIPLRCLARNPNEVKYMSLERDINGTSMTDLILIMEEAGDAEREAWTEIPKRADVQTGDDISFLLEEERDDKSAEALFKINR
ncbi:hypothetical protein TGDOM2_217530 [Toxoplasma gondii GAB2-2007-GAL-DOM2]|uniref:Transmembrane protein n=2 Tax=Toxoplasma gondii TaxID=5811 RepID=A0A086L1Y9_TOXGO|nr:hypothetical protein TGDOM2_217530 [Toxoplasma gondii GAB2-2007-GAL-DOM2]KFG50657.1 hypothetical protein TGFOU_217530 [Toxoplasma gondii FOU]